MGDQIEVVVPAGRKQLKSGRVRLFKFTRVYQFLNQHIAALRDAVGGTRKFLVGTINYTELNTAGAVSTLEKAGTAIPAGYRIIGAIFEVKTPFVHTGTVQVTDGTVAVASGASTLTKRAVLQKFIPNQGVLAGITSYATGFILCFISAGFMFYDFIVGVSGTVVFAEVVGGFWNLSISKASKVVIKTNIVFDFDGVFTAGEGKYYLLLEAVNSEI